MPIAVSRRAFSFEHPVSRQDRLNRLKSTLSMALLLLTVGFFGNASASATATQTAELTTQGKSELPRMVLSVSQPVQIQVRQTGGRPLEVMVDTHPQMTLLLSTATPTNTPTNIPASEVVDTPYPTLPPTISPDHIQPPPTDPPDTPTVYVSSIEGRFFSGMGPSFAVTTQTPPAFTQQFPVINLDPGYIDGCIITPPVNRTTVPFTDVDGCQTIPALAIGVPTASAGEGSLTSFQAAFFGTLYVSEAAEVSFKIYHDDGFIWGVGPRIGGTEQPYRARGVFNPPPPPTPPIGATPWPTTAFQHYFVVGQENTTWRWYPEDIVVTFPAAGYYPFELDYAEDGGNGFTNELSLSLMNAENTPIWNGPSPTPECYPPVTATWPWCPPVNTPTAAPSAPAGAANLVTKSYYIRPTPVGGPSRPYYANAGASDADAMANAGLPNGIVVLDFGMPWFNQKDPTNPDNDDWGTKLTGSVPTWMASSEIMNVVAEYALGFYNRSQQLGVQQRIILAVGTTNFVQWDDTRPGLPPIYSADDFRRHGRHWGNMIAMMSNQLVYLDEVVKIEAANDIEIGWSPPSLALSWAQGYAEIVGPGTSLGPHYYYVNGACEGCYPAGINDNPNLLRRCAKSEGATVVPTNCWTIDQIVGTNWANPAARSLPQVYATNSAKQWQWISSYAATHYICLPDYGIPVNFRLPIAYSGVTASTGSGFLHADAAWQELWMALNGASCTSLRAEDMPFATTMGGNLTIPK